MSALVLAGVEIHHDSEGRFSLNDFHRAAGGEDRHSPNRWTRTEECAGLVGELTPELASAPVKTKRGGKSPGTYVCKELVYAYAQWISPKFHLHVIRTFDSVATEHAAVPVQPKQLQADMQSTVSALLLIGEAIKQVPGIKPGIAMACTLSMIEVNTGLDVTEARKALPAKNDPVCDLNATALGKLAGMSGKAANLALAGAGLQAKNDRGEWELTEAGRKWAEALPFERRGHAGYQILWNRDVLGVLGLDELGPQVA